MATSYIHSSQDTVCYPNVTASIIFEFSDGKLNTEEIVARVVFPIPAGVQRGVGSLKIIGIATWD
jgi:hypothetical protein